MKDEIRHILEKIYREEGIRIKDISTIWGMDNGHIILETIEIIASHELNPNLSRNVTWRRGEMRKGSEETNKEKINTYLASSYG